uniref:hypothetical protein n=1 Tax=Pedobacter schmidteae TaxID=2201271 RepID=UPI000EB3207D|nr:hypothetical protein [Pedobacter schmidteae]
MLSNLLYGNGPNKKSLKDFIDRLEKDSRNYKAALALKPSDIQQASMEEMLENADDLSDGVVRVEKIFGKHFFGLFSSLLVKHRDRGDITLMFYEKLHNPSKILLFFSQLEEILGQGLIEGEHFSSFRERQKVIDLARGIYANDTDELIHLWNVSGFTSLLNYRIQPLGQLLFSVTLKAEQHEDLEKRSNGTLIDHLRNPLYHYDFQQVLKRLPFEENGKIKFIDYDFFLEDPEFGLFDRAKVRLFSTDAEYSMEIQTHVTYHTSTEVSIPLVLDLVDLLTAIYGTDSLGHTKLSPDDIDSIRRGKYWSGKSWYLDTEHMPWVYVENGKSSLYHIGLRQHPQEQGFELDIIAYNQMEKYDLGLM